MQYRLHLNLQDETQGKMSLPITLSLDPKGLELQLEEI